MSTRPFCWGLLQPRGELILEESALSFGTLDLDPAGD